KKDGPNAPLTIVALSNYGVACQWLGDYDRALKVHRDAEDRARTSHPGDVPLTLRCEGRCAANLASLARNSEAIVKYEGAIQKARAVLGTGNHATLRLQIGLAKAHRQLGNVDRAIRLTTDALKLSSSRNSTSQLTWRITLADLYRENSELELASKELGMVQPILDARYKPTDSIRIYFAYAYGRLQLDSARWEKATQSFRTCIEQEQRLPPNDLFARYSELFLAIAQARLGNQSASQEVLSQLNKRLRDCFSEYSLNRRVEFDRYFNEYQNELIGLAPELDWDFRVDR
ncbi:MAG: tetratricopeptide repeat protein, partial [Planctomycetota bacterium]